MTKPKGTYVQKPLNLSRQRVAYNDALKMLEKAIANDRNKYWPAMAFVEDWAGGSDSFIRQDIVESFIKKLTR